MRGHRIRNIAVFAALLSAALLALLWLGPGTRSTERAANSLLATSQQAMQRSSRLDLSLAMGTKKREAAIDSMIGSAKMAGEKAALLVLQECLIQACDKRETHAIGVKYALANEMGASRAVLESERRSQRRREAILFGLLILATLFSLSTVLQARLRDAAPGNGEDLLEETLRNRLEELYAAKKRGRENARFAAFGEVAAGLSHGLKTPLACVRAATQVAQAKIGDGHPAQTNLDDVLDEVDGLVQQINRFLKTMGSGAPMLEKVEAKALLAPIDERYRQGVPNKKATWRMSIAEETPLLLVESELIEMALRNLIDNAFEATREGTEVHLEVRPCGAPERVGVDASRPDERSAALSWTEIAVVDAGTGISPMKAGAEKAESTRDEGSGLGIAIARRIAARFGGALVLAPREDGEGTRASLVLPPILDESDVDEPDVNEPDVDDSALDEPNLDEPEV